MHKNNIKCIFQCNEVEDQIHVFTQSYPVMSQTTAMNSILNHNDIFGNIYVQNLKQKKVLVEGDNFLFSATLDILNILRYFCALI